MLYIFHNYAMLFHKSGSVFAKPETKSDFISCQELQKTETRYIIKYYYSFQKDGFYLAF